MTAALLALLSCQSPEAPASDSKSTVTAPPVPTDLQAASGNAEASLAWTAAARATSYELRFVAAATAADFHWTDAAAVASKVVTTSPTYHLAGLVNGTVYQVAVVAVNAAGASAPTAPVTVAPVDTVPVSPVVTLASMGSQSASFQWTAVTGATGYRIYVLAPGANVATSTGIPVTGLSYTASGLTNGLAYTAVVVASNSGGDSAPSAPVSVTPLATPVVTAQPGRSGQIDLSWPTVAGASSYALSVNGGTAVTTTGTTYTASGLTDGVSYTFVVKALGPSGPSAASAAVTQSPASQLGVAGALEGTWAWTETQKISGTTPVTYTASVALTITGATFVAKQTNTAYSDGRVGGDLLYATGTVAYRSVDQAAVLTTTQQSTDGTSWTAVNLVSVYRNLLVDGRWHPDAWVRVGTGVGLAGTWRTIAEQSVANDPKFYLVQYTFPTGAGQAEVAGYEVTGDTTASEIKSSLTDYTWASPVLGLTDLNLSFTLARLSDGLYDVSEVDSPARTGQPTDPFTLP